VDPPGKSPNPKPPKKLSKTKKEKFKKLTYARREGAEENP